jgi:hypothetical protein
MPGSVLKLLFGTLAGTPEDPHFVIEDMVDTG